MIRKMVGKVFGTHLLAGQKRQYLWSRHKAAFTLILNNSQREKLEFAKLLIYRV